MNPYSSPCLAIAGVSSKVLDLIPVGHDVNDGTNAHEETEDMRHGILKLVLRLRGLDTQASGLQTIDLRP